MIPEDKKSELIQFKVDKNTMLYVKSRVKGLKGYKVADYMRMLVNQDYDLKVLGLK